MTKIISNPFQPRVALLKIVSMFPLAHARATRSLFYAQDKHLNIFGIVPFYL